MPTEPADVAAWRKAERARLLAAREAIPLAERREDDARITERVVEGFALLRGLVVGFYWPFKGEVDPRVALLRLREGGARAALPVVIEKKAPLQFREWGPGCVTQPGVFDLPVPVEGAIVVPDAVLAPPVGFDARGYRLGYGGGYFDRTLAALSPRPIAIALAREASRIETIHPQPYDVPMDFVVTEGGIHQVTASGLRLLAEAAQAGRIAEAIRAGRAAGAGASGA
jgi:5-formyltetrahydrofolate cyclo-ligase